MAKRLIVATRAGDLATTQTNSVIAELKKAHPGLDVEIKLITTSGDKDRVTELWKLKSTGFFTSQVEDALVAKEADFAVHSFKDLPTKFREGLTVTAIWQRNFVEDALLAAKPVSCLDELPEGANVGTSSLRRISQLKHLRSDLQPVPLRGNVPTRVRKLEEGEYDAIILARAGLERLSLADKISFSFDPTVFIPAPAQGALGIQTRADDDSTNEIISTLDDANARIVTDAERHVLDVMQCGCHAPVGATAKIKGDRIVMIAFIANPDGSNFIRREVTGAVGQSLGVAEEIGNQLLGAGGREILDQRESNR